MGWMGWAAIPVLRPTQGTKMDLNNFCRKDREREKKRLVEMTCLLEIPLKLGCSGGAWSTLVENYITFFWITIKIDQFKWNIFFSANQEDSQLNLFCIQVKSCPVINLTMGGALVDKTESEKFFRSKDFKMLEVDMFSLCHSLFWNFS